MLDLIKPPSADDAVVMALDPSPTKTGWFVGRNKESCEGGIREWLNETRVTKGGKWVGAVLAADSRFVDYRLEHEGIQELIIEQPGVVFTRKVKGKTMPTFGLWDDGMVLTLFMNAIGLAQVRGIPVRVVPNQTLKKWALDNGNESAAKFVPWAKRNGYPQCQYTDHGVAIALAEYGRQFRGVEPTLAEEMDAKP